MTSLSAWTGCRLQVARLPITHARSPSCLPSHHARCAAKQHARGCAATEHASNAHRPHHSKRLRRYACTMFMLFERAARESSHTLLCGSLAASRRPWPTLVAAQTHSSRTTTVVLRCLVRPCCKALYARGCARFSVPLQRHRVSSGWLLISSRIKLMSGHSFCPSGDVGSLSA